MKKIKILIELLFFLEKIKRMMKELKDLQEFKRLHEEKKTIKNIQKSDNDDEDLNFQKNINKNKYPILTCIAVMFYTMIAIVHKSNPKPFQFPYPTTISTSSTSIKKTQQYKRS